MKQAEYTLESRRDLVPGVSDMILSGDCGGITVPGQFVNVALPGFYLRRPLSVCERREDRFRVIFRAVGEGTSYLSGLEPGARLDILTGLGNGFDVSKAGERPLLIGGGLGIPPLLWLSKELSAGGARVTAVLGFNTEREIFCLSDFADSGAEVITVTADGSFGEKGLAPDIMNSVSDYTYFFACGPEPMLKEVCARSRAGGQLSFEARMGCGFGACMGCSRPTAAGSKRICKDGPVLEKDEVIWQTSP